MRFAVSGCRQQSGLARLVAPLGSVSGRVVIRSVGLRSRHATGVVLLIGIPTGGGGRIQVGSAILKVGFQKRTGAPFARCNGWMGHAWPRPMRRLLQSTDIASFFGCHGYRGVHASTGEDLGTSAVAPSETISQPSFVTTRRQRKESASRKSTKASWARLHQRSLLKTSSSQQEKRSCSTVLHGDIFVIHTSANEIAADTIFWPHSELSLELDSHVKVVASQIYRLWSTDTDAQLAPSSLFLEPSKLCLAAVMHTAANQLLFSVSTSVNVASSPDHQD